MTKPKHERPPELVQGGYVIKQAPKYLDRVLFDITYGELDTAMLLSPGAARDVARRLLVHAAEVERWITEKELEKEE